MTQKIDRRRFLSIASALPALPVAAAVADETRAAKENEPTSNNDSNENPTRVKFSVFADIHHYPGVFMSQTPDHLTQIQERAVREKCDFIIHCGDFTHNPPSVSDFVDQYNRFSIPSYHTLGNHDQDGCDWKETLKAYQMPDGHYFFDKNGFRFVVLDPNYILNDGVYEHYSKSNYYKAPGNQPIFPPEQLAWLAETLETAPGPCVLFSHQSVEREVGGVVNWRETRAVIDAANRDNPGRVRLYVNGHYHRDNLRLLNGVLYFDLNSASYDWCEKTHRLYPKELCEEYRLVDHTVVYNDPIHAVVTMDVDGTLEIAGMESSMFYDVTREQAGMSFADEMGRPVVPRVQSAKMKFLL